jgi:hypothetical protein
MTPKDFVVQLRAAVVDENTEIYRNLFSTTEVEAASDPYWKRALSMFEALPLEHRATFFEVVRQVSVDATSNILGVVDGVTTIGDGNVELRLMCGEQKISGDLQSLFLVEEERDSGKSGSRR